MIKAIYAKVQSCVKLSYNNTVSISDFFEVTIGLKQGKPLSPILFILSINDIASTNDYNCFTQDDLELLSRYLILFADDIVLFTTDSASLQTQIDNSYRYSLKLGLKINVAKTNMCFLENENKYIEKNSI